jgi:hypothetical protein
MRRSPVDVRVMLPQMRERLISQIRYCANTHNVMPSGTARPVALFMPERTQIS